MNNIDAYKENYEYFLYIAKDKILPYFEKVKEESEVDGLKAVVQAAYEITDKTIRVHKDQAQITCSKGCSFCCQDEIFMTPLEADYITWQLSHSNNKNLKPNKGRLKRQNRVKNYKDLSWKDKACSFLFEDGTCSIYEIRPLICRKHNSTSPPEKCDRSKDPNSSVREAIYPVAEAVFMALIKLSDMESAKDTVSLHKVLKNKYL